MYATMYLDNVSENGDDEYSNIDSSSDNDILIGASSKIGHTTFFPGHYSYLASGSQIRVRSVACMNANRGVKDKAPALKNDEIYFRRGTKVEQVRETGRDAEAKNIELQLGCKGLPVFHNLNYYSPVRNSLNDFFHLFYNNISNLFEYMIRMNFDANRYQQYRAEKRQLPHPTLTSNSYRPVDDFFLRPDNRPPWQASNTALRRIIKSHVFRKVPANRANELDQPFDFNKDGKPTLLINSSANWIWMIGHIGIYYIHQLDIHPYYQDIFTQYLWWMCKLRRRFTQKKKFDEYEKIGKDILAQLEFMMPVHFNTILLHILHHSCSTLKYTGPPHSTWMMTTERWNQIAKGRIHSGTSPEEGLMKASMTDEWLTFSKYKTKEDRDAIMKPPLDHNTRYPTVKSIGAGKNIIFEREDKYSPYRNVLAFLLSNDPVLMILNDEFKSKFPKQSKTGDKTIDNWDPSPDSLIRINYRFVRKFHKQDSSRNLMIELHSIIGCPISNINKYSNEQLININNAINKRFPVTVTMNELKEMIKGPTGTVIEYQRFQVNDTVFCTNHYESRKRTIRITRKMIKFQTESKSAAYGMIDNIFSLSSHSVTRLAKHYDILKITNFPQERKEMIKKGSKRTVLVNHPSGLKQVTKVSQRDNLAYHVIIYWNQVYPYNVAAWPLNCDKIDNSFLMVQISPLDDEIAAEQIEDHSNVLSERNGKDIAEDEADPPINNNDDANDNSDRHGEQGHADDNEIWEEQLESKYDE
jgi:hypothetical protein